MLTVESLAVIYHTASFNIQNICVVLTLCLCVLCGLYGPCNTVTDWSCVAGMESDYCAVRTGSLHKTDKFRL